jgi:HEPN domain-containing protein
MSRDKELYEALQKLITDLPHMDIKTIMEELIEESAVLDRYYIPTRYPNGLPDLTPGKYYFQKDASLCIESAERIINKVKDIVGSEH